MKYNTIPAFTEEQRKKVHTLLARRVTYMMGRKWEEGDWSEVYCKAKDIPNAKWSNLNIDIMYKSLGVEHKMYCYRSKSDLSEAMGTSIMHPSATRAIRIPSKDINSNEAMRDILSQYADLIIKRTEKVKQQSGEKYEPDMRTGYLLWQQSLKQFLYFEERMNIPNPDNYFAEWKSSKESTRKSSKNLWIYEKDTGRKRFSVTTEAGAKIQPYFDIPPPSDPNLYLFTVIGEVVDNGNIRVWLTEATARELKQLLGDLSSESLSSAILSCVEGIKETNILIEHEMEKAESFLISLQAYELIQEFLPGVNDEHRFQKLATYFRSRNN